MNLPSPNPANPPTQRLVWQAAELQDSLKVCYSTLWKWEKQGRLKSVPGLRHKIYTTTEVERFLSGKGASL